MSTRTDLENALKEAMRAHDDLSKNTLRMALSAIKQVEVDKRTSLDDLAVIAVLQKEVSTRREALEEARRAGRSDLEEAAQKAIAVLERFLPQAIPAEELEALARQVIAEVGASSLREMGQVMKILLPRLKGRATGDQASQMVRKLLG